MKKLGIFLVFFISTSVFAFEFPYTMRSPKALLMGDAYTAVNDDEYTLFYNPATLGRHKHDLTLHPFSGQLAATNILKDMNRFQNFPSTADGAANVLMDYPVHASAGIAPGFKLFNFGLSVLTSQSFDALLRNKSHPMLDLDLRQDKGVVMGFALPIGPGRINKKSNNGSQTSLGISTKYIERTGVKDTLALAGPTVIGALGQSEVDKLLNSLGKVKGRGWGFDAGLEHVARSGNSQFVLGLSALDITGTEFSVNKNTDKMKVANTKDQVNLGMAAGQDFTLFHYIISADVRGLNEQMDFGRRVRLGAQIGIPGITLLGGMNSGYYSYGAEIDLMFMKLTTGFYDVELGSKYKQIKSSRFIIYLSLFDFSFDA